MNTLLPESKFYSTMNQNAILNKASDTISDDCESTNLSSDGFCNSASNKFGEPSVIPKYGISLFVDVFVVVLISVLVSIAIVHFYSKWGASSYDRLAIDDILVTVNFDAIVKEQMQALTERVRNGDIEASDMPARTEKFTLALMDKINEQASEGKIVMRADQVLAAPANIPDLTDKLRKELRSEGVMERRSEESSKSKDAK